MSLNTRTLIEAGDLPIDVISRDAAIEMSFKPRPAYYARCKELGVSYSGLRFYDPKVRNIHPWLARRSRSVARFSTLAAFLPPSTSREELLKLMGFTEEELRNAVKSHYPPLISYLTPPDETSKYTSNRIVLDPMAGGGTIPLEATILGAKSISIDYNPLAYLILKATIEFPAKYGIELWRKVCSEAEKLISYAEVQLSNYYQRVDGYIHVKSVLKNGKNVPLTTSIRLTTKLWATLHNGKIMFRSSVTSKTAFRELLYTWIIQHVRVMEGNRDIYEKTLGPLIVQVGGSFREAKESELDSLLKAYEKYLELREHVPAFNISLPYGNEIFSSIMNLRKYGNLFTPRQAMSLAIISKYLKKRFRELLSEGEFGAAVSLYLALGISRMIDFNSVLTSWNYNTKTIRDSTGSYYKYRKLKLEEVHAEGVVPYKTLSWIYEPWNTKETAGGICPIVKELAEKLEDKGDKVEVYLGDAQKLSEIVKNKVDLVNIDPPYYNQHMYGDFSEFFWPYLRDILDPVLDILFKDSVKIQWNYKSYRVPKKEEVIAKKLGDISFEIKLAKVLREASVVLKENGLIIIWYTHRDVRAWNALVRSIKKAGLTITSIVPVVSEHPTRSITKGGRVGINRVLLVVLRKEESKEPIEDIVERMYKLCLKAKMMEREDPREECLLLRSVIEKSLKLK